MSDGQIVPGNITGWAMFTQHFFLAISSSFQRIGIAQAQVSQPILKLHYISGWGCFGMSGSNPFPEQWIHCFI